VPEDNRQAVITRAAAAVPEVYVAALQLQAAAVHCPQLYKYL
jgi:hypothetical protein